MVTTKDDSRRDERKRRAAFEQVRRAETQYAVQLRKVASNIDSYVKGMIEPNSQVLDMNQHYRLMETLTQYAATLESWAKSVALRMITDVAQRDERAWTEYTKGLSADLKQEIRDAPTGEAMRTFLATQVELIKSLPLQAAERVHELTQEALVTGARYPEIAKKIYDTGHVTKSRANLIARTEVARTASTLTMVRAQSIGADQYIWRTSQDADVRPTHKAMANKVCDWDKPPLVERNPNKYYHAGMFPNCRCYPEPILSEKYLA